RQLLLVTSPKPLPALHLMAEPLPQLGAGGHLLHPCICSDGFLLRPSWPEALHQDPPTVSTRRRVIRALDPKHDGFSAFVIGVRRQPFHSKDHQWPAPPADREPTGWASTHLK